MVTAVLADGSRYTFDYDNYGQVKFIGLPTGGSISYTWTTIDFASCNPASITKRSRAVATRTLNDGNGHSYTWRYNWGSPAGGSLSNTVTDPMGNDTVHVFTDQTPANSSLQPACRFYETSTIQYQGSAAANKPMQRVDTTYTAAAIAVDLSDPNVDVGVANVFATDIVTTLYTNGTPTKVKKIHKDPDKGLGAGLPIFGNTIRELEYDWGTYPSAGPLLRETDTTYQWQLNAAFRTAGLLDLPAKVSVIDPGTNSPTKSNCPGWDANLNATTKACVAETDYGYDELSLQPNSGGIPAGTLGSPAAVRGNQTTVSKWLSTTNSMVSSQTKWYDTGEVYQKVDPLLHTTTYTYDSAYAGAYVTKTCSPQTGTIAHCVSGTYDFNTGVLTSFTNENATQQATGNTQGDSAHTSNYSYDLMFRLTSAQAPPDPANGGARATTSFSYSSGAGVFPWTATRTRTINATSNDSATSNYDGFGRVFQTRHVTPAGNAIVDTVYDPLGRVASVSNPYFSTSDATYGLTQTIYDPLDRPVLTQKADGSYSTVTYHDNCTTAQDEAGKSRRSCTDALGRLLEVDEPGDSSAASATDTSNTDTSATGFVNISGADQVVIIPPPKCTPGQTCDQTPDTVYDSGTISIIVNGKSYSTTYGSSDTGDSLGTKIVNAIAADPNAVVTATNSSGLISLTSKTTGRSSDYSLAFSTTWDSGDFAQPSFAGLISGFRLVAGANDSVFAHSWVTQYHYDILGNLLCVEQHGNAAGSPCPAPSTAANSTPVPPDTSNPWRLRRFAYDSLSRLRWASNPESGVISYAYDADSNLISKTDARSVTVNYSPSDLPIDELHRVRKKTYSATDPAVTYAWDTAANGIGKLASVTDGAGSETYNYDVLGRLTAETRTTAGVQMSVAAKYDLANNITELDYPSSRVVTYGYNSANWLNNVTFSKWAGADPHGGAYTYWSVADTNFYANGTPKLAALGNGVTEYSALNNRLQLQQETISNTAMGTASDHVYSYGSLNNGNILSVADQLNSARTQNYTYDSLNRLATAGETGNRWGLSFVYDAWGNFLQQNFNAGTVSTHVYSADVTNRLIGYGYDPAGNMLGDGFHQYAYDSESRIKTVDPNLTPVAATYSYDSDGNRVKKDANGTSTWYLYFNGQPLAERTAAGDWNDFIYAGGKRITRATSYEDGILIQGTNNASTGQWAWYWFSSVTDPDTHSAPVIRSGDKLMFRQSQSSNARGGINMNFSDGSSVGWSAKDTAGAYVNSWTVTDQLWHLRTVDLSAWQGKTVSAVYVGVDNQSLGGAWWELLADVVIVHADGTLVPLYNGESSVAMSGPTYGPSMTGVNYTNRHLQAIGHTTATTTYYYHGDQIGSSRLMTSPNGIPVWQATYLPYGEEYNPEITVNNRKFSGKERDTESGLDYFGARYYGSALGRFITPDWAAKATAVPYAEFADPQSLNLYTYVRNVPTTRVDFDGHWDWPSLSDVRDFVAGVANAYGSDNLAGAGRIDGGSKAYQMGQVVGDGAAMVSGVGEVGAGTAGEAGGLALDATGGGAVVGVPVNIASAGVIAHGATTTTVAGAHLGQAVVNAFSGNKNDSNGSKGGDTAGKKFNDSQRAEDAGKDCTYCGQKTTEEPGKPNSRETDHICPRCQGGNTTQRNRAPACRTCNRSKAGRTPKQWRQAQKAKEK